MGLIRFEQITKSFAGAPVLTNVDFRVERGEKIGLIGRNGTGKTTIFRLITGEIEPESGLVERMRAMRVAHLDQLPAVNDETAVLDVAMTAFAELIALEKELARLEHAMADGDEDALHAYSKAQDVFTTRGGYLFRAEAKRVLQGLGFGPETYAQPVNTLSGGQRTRLNLASILLREADILLLDEPENHLDIDAREWLETYLSECEKAVIIISHDRRMLNTVARRTVEIESNELRGFTGNYDAYKADKELISDQQRKAFTRQQDQIRKEEQWIERFRYKNTKARQVQSRIKRLEKLERIEAPQTEAQSANFQFGEVVRTGQVVLTAENLAMSYGGQLLYKDFSLELRRGQRVGVIGPNGSGKTTLLRHLAGQLGPQATGVVQLGHKAVMGVYEQRHEQLNPQNDILAEVGSQRPDMTPEQIRTYMGAFLFRGDDIFKRVGNLSGGELSRVAIAKLILSDANLLLLDEPTNHLDIPSRETLEAALEQFHGTLFMVSHDRALVDKLADRLIVVEDGQATVHLGDYSDYRRTLENAIPQQQTNAPKPQNDRRAAQKKQERIKRTNRRSLEAIERDIETAETRADELEQLFSTTDPADFQRLGPLREEYDGLKQEIAHLYDQWETLAKKVLD